MYGKDAFHLQSVSNYIQTTQDMSDSRCFVILVSFFYDALFAYILAPSISTCQQIAILG
jgi:hypothetical protein